MLLGSNLAIPLLMSIVLPFLVFNQFYLLSNDLSYQDPIYTQQSNLSISYK